MQGVDFEKLKERVEELEHRSRRPYLLLLVVFGAVVAVLMQAAIDRSLVRQINTLYQIQRMQGEGHAK